MHNPDNAESQQPVVPIEKVRELIRMTKPGNRTEASCARLAARHRASDLPRIGLKARPHDEQQ